MTTEYDTTGKIEAFSVTEEFVVFKREQVIRLNDVGFFIVKNRNGSTDEPHSLKVTAIITGESGSEERELSRGSVGFQKCDRDGNIENEDQGVTQAKAEAMTKSSDATFDPDFAAYVKINAFGSNSGQLGESRFKVRIKYQRYKKSVLEEQTIIEGVGPRYSPGLMQSVLDRIDLLENKNSDTNMFGTDLNANEILEEDITGSAPENYVRYERHAVNTRAGVSIIQPARGSFYASGLEVLVYQPTLFTLTNSDEDKARARNKLFIYTDTTSVIDSSNHLSTEYHVILTDAVMNKLLSSSSFNGQVSGKLVDILDTSTTLLKEGIDYEIDAIDIARTARSLSSIGVYQNIRFKTSYVGEVLISYHAFGGFVSTGDIRQMHQDITNTRSILKNTNLVTSDTLGDQLAIIELNRRLRTMEAFHNHFHQVEHKVNITTPGFHWINIAAIYDVNWGTPIKDINDIGQFKIQSALRRWSYEFMVDVDINRAAGDILRIKTLGTNQYSSYGSESFTKVLLRDNLAVRLCWIDNGNSSGVVLQIGWDYKSYLENNLTKNIDIDTVVVTDKSGLSSMWTLLTDAGSLNILSNGLIGVYNHAKYYPTADRTYQSGKNYYIYKNSYLFVRSSDRAFVAGKTYYLFNDSASGTDQYYVLSEGNANYVIGGSTDPFLEDDGEGGQVLGLYERVLYGKYPVVDTSVIVGSRVIAGTYELDEEASFTQDTSFSMPNEQFVWSENGDGCNSCIKLIEPDDGVIAWMGNVSLAEHAYKPVACEDCGVDVEVPTATRTEPDAYTCFLMFCDTLQNYIALNTIHGITLVLFDRYDGKYVTARTDIQSGGVSLQAEVPFCYEDMCFAKVELKKVSSSGKNLKYDRVYVENSQVKYRQDDPDGELIQMGVVAYLGSMSLDMDRYDLRQVRLHF